MSNRNITIDEAINDIESSKFRKLLKDSFELAGYDTRYDTVGTITLSNLPNIIESIILGAVEILRADESELYALVSDQLYFIFYQSRLFPTIKDVSAVTIHLRRYFIRYVLRKQIPELLMLFMEQGIFPQFYSFKVIEEIKATDFTKLIKDEKVTSDEIIGSATFSSCNINTTFIAMNVIDEVIEDIMYNKTKGLYEEVSNIIDNAAMFRQIPVWFNDDQDLSYREIELVSIISRVFEQDYKDIDYMFDEDRFLEESNALFREHILRLAEYLTGAFATYTSSHKDKLGGNFVVTNYSFHKVFDNIFLDYVALFIGDDSPITLNQATLDDETKKLINKLILRLSSYTMGYIMMEFLYRISDKDIAPNLYFLILNTILQEELCFRIYEVNPE